ncbi:MAG TPA: HAMP domain-containing sensor histidine kinase [Puia sp.]|nr:HAMP domain-containing sensor histidine kinase [Puia sp.]
MRKIGILGPFVTISGTDSLLPKASFYLFLNLAVFGIYIFSGHLAGNGLMVGFLIGLVFYLFDAFLFRLICVSATMLVYVSLQFGFLSGIIGSLQTGSATRMNSSLWSIYVLMVFVLVAFVWYFVNKNVQLLCRLKEYSRKVEADLEKEMISGQNKTKFIRNAYHEIRGQFWAVFIIAKVLAKSHHSGESQNMSSILNDLTNGCQNLQLLLNNILEYSKFESGISELATVEPINPRLKIGGLIELCQYAAREKNIQITLWVADDLPDYVACDNVKLTQVVMNLINNAIKFSRPDIIICVVLHKDADWWCISIRDRGKGICPDRLPYIFEPFVSGKCGGKNCDGVGLGLHITKQLVTALQGEIKVRSRENAGSCFTVCLPILPFDTLIETLDFPDPPHNYSRYKQ